MNVPGNVHNGGVPVVTTACRLSGETLTVIDVDNADGARQAMGCRLEYGHRRIAMITGPPSWRSVRDRAQGYARALESAAIDYDPGPIAEGDWSYQSGYQAMQELLARGQAFSALFAQNDRMAIGAMRAARSGPASTARRLGGWLRRHTGA